MERTRRADFEQQIQSELQTAIQKMENLSGAIGKNQDEVRAAMDGMRESSAQAAADEIRRWNEQMDLRAADTQARLTQMDTSAIKLAEQIAASTAIGEGGWRGRLEADLAAASTRWQEKIDSSIEESSRRAAEQIARNSDASAKLVEEQLQQRMHTLGDAHSQITAEAESALVTLHGAIGEEAAKGETLISRLRESILELETRRGEFSQRCCRRRPTSGRGAGSATLEAQRQ